AEDGVVAVQRWIGRLGDEKRRAVGVRTGVGVGEASGLIKVEIGPGLVLDLDADVAGAASGGVAALDHELGNDAVEGGVVIEGNAVHGFAGFGVCPALGAAGQTDEVGGA